MIHWVQVFHAAETSTLVSRWSSHCDVPVRKHWSGVRLQIEHGMPLLEKHAQNGAGWSGKLFYGSSLSL
jgi:hypothetical protein